MSSRECDAYIKNRLEFIKKHSTYGMIKADTEERQKEVLELYRKQDEYNSRINNN